MMKALYSVTKNAGGRSLTVSGWTMIVVAASIVAWGFTLIFMSGMDEGPWTPLGNLPAFLVGWIVMLTAMMLPSELNYIGAFAGMLRGRGTEPGERRRLMLSFISGYGFAWITYGLIAYALDWLVRAVSPDFVAWNRGGPYLAGAVLVLAGFYQLSSLKHACLKGCRSPFSFFQQHWKEGTSGALSMGFRHGLVCVGCCWALMGVMFAVGAMSLTWMALLTLFMFAEKVLPKGRALANAIAAFLIAMGLWITISPQTAPLLKKTMVFASVCKSLF